MWNLFVLCSYGYAEDINRDNVIFVDINYYNDPVPENIPEPVGTVTTSTIIQEWGGWA